MTISLNGAWALQCAWPYTPILAKSLETGGALMGLFDAIPARVPGGVYGDLLAAGLIDDPLAGMNSLGCEWVESKWWIYERSFAVPARSPGRRAFLRFEGLDYRARVYLNGREIAACEGTCVPLEVEITSEAREGDNLLRVVFEETPREVAIGRTRDVHTVKPRFGYKWDFGTRLVNVGIWDDVRLILTGPARLSDLQADTDWDGARGIICLKAASDAPAVTRAEICAPDGTRQQKESTGGSLRFTVDHPALWYPNGAGDQPLYRVRIELLVNGAVSDETELSVGIRALRFAQNEGAPQDALPYTICVNDRRLFVKGVNWVPLMHEYGLADDALYEKMLSLARDMGANLVRVWGGGLIEKEIFYRLCDQMGLMVWQEFTQSGAGVESVPREDDEYLRLLDFAARSAVSRRRNHTSLAVWCGGNELRAQPGADTPVTLENRNARLLLGIVKDLDPGRQFYPSSASGPFEFVQEGAAHDAHGFWRYLGPRAHYEMYNHTDNLLHSEYGVDGMSSPESVSRALGRIDPGISDMKRDIVWRFHGEWWDNLAENEKLFGAFDSLADFSLASQIVQAEGVRYIAESDMRRAPHCSGTIVWQFNEPWRNVSCTNLVEYLGKPKLAYYALQNAFAPVAASLRYETVCPEVGEKQSVSVWLSAFDRPGTYLVRWTAHAPESSGDQFPSGEAYVETEGGCVRVASFDLIAPEGLLFIALEVYQGTARLHQNRYFFAAGTNAPLRALLRYAKEGDLFA